MDLRTWTFVNILAPSPFLGAAAAKQQENVACFVSDGQAKLKDERLRWDEDDHFLRDVVIGFQENEPDPTQQSTDVKFENSKEITRADRRRGAQVTDWDCVAANLHYPYVRFVTWRIMRVNAGGTYEHMSGLSDLVRERTTK